MLMKKLLLVRFLVAAGCEFASLLLDFAAICIRKWLILLRGIMVR